MYVQNSRPEKGSLMLRVQYLDGTFFWLAMAELLNTEYNLTSLPFIFTQGVLTLKNTYFEPRYVLMLPMTQTAHERRLRERNTYTEVEIDSILKRGSMYAEYNRLNPGFFDMMIPTGEIFQALWSEILNNVEDGRLFLAM